MYFPQLIRLHWQRAYEMHPKIRSDCAACIFPRARECKQGIRGTVLRIGTWLPSRMRRQV
jgi:hypothetical protein